MAQSNQTQSNSNQSNRNQNNQTSRHPDRSRTGGRQSAQGSAGVGTAEEDALHLGVEPGMTGSPEGGSLGSAEGASEGHPSSRGDGERPSTRAKRAMKVVWMVEDKTRPSGEKLAIWTRVGAAFENRDGSWSIDLAAVPLNGSRLQLRDPAPAREAA
jgi:hypothetical protein